MGDVNVKLPIERVVKGAHWKGHFFVKKVYCTYQKSYDA